MRETTKLPNKPLQRKNTRGDRDPVLYAGYRREHRDELPGRNGGGDIEIYENDKKLIAAAGLNPSTYQSGKREGESKIIKRGDRHLRRVIWIMTTRVITNNEVFRAYFFKRRREGLPLFNLREDHVRNNAEETTSPAFAPIDSKKGEARLQKLWSLIVYILVAICCVTQTLSESKAGEEASREGSWRRIDETIIYRSNTPTRVTVIGNSVLVPVTLVYQGNQVDVQLLLDTGASGTVINTEIADRLNVNLSIARKTRGRVLGGTGIEAHQVTLSRITVGPHTKESAVIFVVRHQGPPAKYDGLLGMDLLRGLKYFVDLEKRIITWE